MRALRVTIEDTSTGRTEEHVFARSPIRIGRTRLNDLRLDSAYVSHYHSIISFSDNAIEYFDLGSTNGTFHRGAAIKPFVPVVVDEASALCIGPLRLKPAHGSEQIIANDGFTVAAGDTDINSPAGTEVNPGAVQELRQAQAAIDALHPSYQTYRDARQKLYDDLRTTLMQIIPRVRALVIPYVPEVFPGIAREPEFRATIDALRPCGNQASAAAPTEPSTDALELLGLGKEVVGPEPDDKRLLQQVAAVLEAFSTCFVELRRGLDQFGTELAVSAFSRQTALHTAHTGREVLAYLVSQEEGNSRVDELTSAFADIMIHQVALIAGITEGVRSLIRRFDPKSVAKDLADDPERVGGVAVRKGMWPWSVTALWRRFRRLHANLVEDDRGVSEVLFGREFARSYDAARMRHQGGTGDERPASGSRAAGAVASRSRSRV